MCDERERLIGYVYDECDPAERQEIARHLEECSTCRTEISDLRGVRQDLLAWEVEGGPAVWRPFVAPVAQPWYKQVPAWAMAAAATLMFLVGAAGGFVTQTFLRGSAAPEIATVVPERAVTLTEAEQRIVDRLRSELVAEINASRPPRAVPGAAMANPDQMMQRVNSMVEQSEQRMLQYLLDASNFSNASTASRDDQIRGLQRSFEQLRQDFALVQGGGGR